MRRAHRPPEGRARSGRAWRLRSRGTSCAFPFEDLSAQRRWRRTPDLAGDEPGAALIGEVVPQPADRHREAAAEANQEPDVRDGPDQPGEETAQLERTHGD